MALRIRRERGVYRVRINYKGVFPKYVPKGGGGGGGGVEPVTRRERPRRGLLWGKNLIQYLKGPCKTKRNRGGEGKPQEQKEKLVDERTVRLMWGTTTTTTEIWEVEKRGGEKRRKA